MRQLTLLIFFTGTCYCSFGQDTKVNLIIKLNDKLLEDGVSNTQLTIETDKDKYNVGVQYYTGDLILPIDVMTIINRDSIKSMTFTFDVSTFKGDKQDILNIKTNFSKYLITQPYVILNVFDLRDKKFKRQLGHLTKDNFLCEYNFPGSGLYIRRR
jgi:hypothetical protein